ncbi:hypothetical protein D3C76_1567100 [compost metagenome]
MAQVREPGTNQRHFPLFLGQRREMRQRLAQRILVTQLLQALIVIADADSRVEHGFPLVWVLVFAPQMM